MTTGLRAFLSGEQSAIPYQLKDSKGALTKSFSGVGTPVHDLRPEQNMALLRLAFASKGITSLSDHQLIIEAGKIFQPELEKVVQKLCGRGVEEIKSRPPKRLERMIEKEALDGLKPQGHTDSAALTVYSKNPAAFIRHTNIFRPCNNSMTAQMKEKAATPDGSEFCGNMVKIILEQKIGKIKVPFVCEVLLMIDGCQDKYTRTHRDMNGERDWDRFYNNPNHKSFLDPTVVVAASVRKDRLSKHKRELNHEMAVASGLAELRQERTYYMVGNTPVMFATNQKGDKHFIVPDAKTGLYRDDQSFAVKIADATRITREQYVGRAREMVPVPDMKKSGGLAPLLAVVEGQPLANIA